MSKYKFNIDNYHAIGHADIEIEGITVMRALKKSPFLRTKTEKGYDL